MHRRADLGRMQHERHHGPWVGTLFAIGHGLLVTMVAVIFSEVGRAIEVPTTFARLFDWAPTTLLLLVALLNVRQLCSGAQAAPTSLKLQLIPLWLRNHAAPWAVVLTGALFAAVFDTATQASAWGYAAGQQGGRWIAALFAGFVFTIGMGVTDTIDGRLLWRIGRRPEGQQLTRQFRRILGWLVVGISCGVAAFNIGKAFAPQFEIQRLCLLRRRLFAGSADRRDAANVGVEAARAETRGEPELAAALVIAKLLSSRLSCIIFCGPSAASML